jgi:hypothetical protein
MVARPRVVLVAWLLALLVAGACESPPPERGSAPTLSTLERIEELRAAFNADRGRPRLVLLLSPT